MMPWRAIGLFVVFVGFCGLSYAQTANTVYHADGSQASPPSSADSNADGWPDNPFAALGDGDLWVSTGSPRTVAALRWSVSGGAGFQPAVQTIDIDVPRPGSSDQRIVIEAPGLLAETGEIAVLLIGVAPDLESLLGNEAAGIAPHDGAALLSGGQYVEISVLISNDGGATFDELNPARLQDAPIRLRMENLSAPVDAFPVLYEHPTYVAANPQSGIQLQAETGIWTPASCVTLPHDERALEDTVYPAYIEAELRSLSVFALLDGTTDSTNTSVSENGGDGDSNLDTETAENGGNSDTESTNELTIEDIVNGGTLDSTGTESLTTEDGEGGGGEPLALMLQPGDPVWADFGYKGELELGTEKSPFNSLGEAVFVAVANNSDTIKIDRVTPHFGSDETLTISSPMTIEAVNGPVRIGQATRILYTDFTNFGAVFFDPVGIPMEGSDPYAINPEYRVYNDGDVVNLTVIPADGSYFKGWWSPNSDFRESVTAEDLLPSLKHKVAMNRDRFIYAIFAENSNGFDLSDNDEDGLAAFRETEFGTSDTDADSDDDGLPDGWEANYDLNPLSSAGDDGPAGDPDGDGVTNLDEFIAGTSPRFDESAPPSAQEPPPADAAPPPNLDDLNPDFNHTDFSSATGITRSGNAVISGTSIRLIPDGGSHAGAVWTSQKVPLAKGFSTSFEFELRHDPPDHDGISFVIQNSSPTPALTQGGQMGYTGISNSLAVEFDAFHNVENGDPTSDHISVHTGGLGANNAAESYSLGSAPVSTLTTGTKTVQITYSPDTNALNVYMNNFLVKAISINLEAALNLSDGKAYIGIMSTSGITEVTSGPTFLLNWSADFITSRTLADLRLLRVTANRDDTGAVINELDGGPTSFEDFNGGFTDWGQPDAYPSELEKQANDNPNRGEYPRSFDIFFDQVAQSPPEDDKPAAFTINLQAFVEGEFPVNGSLGGARVSWSFEPGSVVAGTLIEDGYNASLRFDANNPPVPGLYKIRCGVWFLHEGSPPPHRTAVAYILLPYAGPEITDWLIEEARQITRPDGVGEQWDTFVAQQASFANIPVVGPLNANAFKLRLFRKVAAQNFFYTSQMTINGVRPTPRFNFSDAERRSTDALRAPGDFNGNSFATLAGLTVARGKITNLLFIVWGLSEDYSFNTLRRAASLASMLGGEGRDDRSSENSYFLGLQLYNVVVEGQSNEQIRQNTLTRSRARDMQTEGDLNDIRLWPRADFSAPPHIDHWTGNQNLSDGLTWTRPTIFVTLDNVQVNP